jgi:hypothetical protein
MEMRMKFRILALGTIAAAAGMVALAAPASAAVVCNGRGDCWHTTDRYDYKPAWGIRVHDDNWKWRSRDHYRWREHEGRGYWGRNHVWVTF